MQLRLCWENAWSPTTLPALWVLCPPAGLYLLGLSDALVYPGSWACTAGAVLAPTPCSPTAPTAHRCPAFTGEPSGPCNAGLPTLLASRGRPGRTVLGHTEPTVTLTGADELKNGPRVTSRHVLRKLTPALGHVQSRPVAAGLRWDELALNACSSLEVTVRASSICLLSGMRSLRPRPRPAESECSGPRGALRRSRWGREAVEEEESRLPRSCSQSHSPGSWGHTWDAFQGHQLSTVPVCFLECQ